MIFSHKTDKVIRTIQLIAGLMVLVAVVLGTCFKARAEEDPNKITRRTFSNYRISSLTIGAGVNEIEAGSFNNLHYLCNINVDANNEKFSSYGGCLYDKNKTTLICFPQGLFSSNIPRTCVKLAPGCLAGKSAYLRRQVKAVITQNNNGEYPEDYPGYDIDRDDEYDRINDPTIPDNLKGKTVIDDDSDKDKNSSKKK